MGLESIEIIIEIEDEFGIKIPDKDAERILTVGGMAQYVEHRLHGTTTPLPETCCGTSRGFYALRRTMMTVLAVDRSAVRPRVKLNTIIPYSIRRQVWVDMERAGLRAPPLATPAGVQLAVIAFAGLIGMLLLSGMLRYGWPTAALVLWIPIAAVIGVCVLRVSNAFLPGSCVTVGDLARQIWVENKDAVHTPGAIADPAVLDRVKIIIAENLRIPKESLHAETRFADILP